MSYNNARKENEFLNKDQQIEQQRLVIEKLKGSNDKLQRKLEYYENFLENIVQFEKSQNVMNMKAFTKAVNWSCVLVPNQSRIFKNLIALLKNAIEIKKNLK